MGQNNDFLQKSGIKTLILTVMVLDQLTLEWARTQNFKGIAISNMCFENIARGTTDPEIDSVTWIKFSNNMAPRALVAYLPTDGTIWIGSKFGHQAGGTICIVCQVGHQVA